MSDEPPSESHEQPDSGSTKPKTDSTADVRKKHWTGRWPWTLWRRLLHGSLPRSESERQVTLGEYQVLLGVIATIPLLAGLAAGLVGLYKLRKDVQQTRLTITSPKDRESVGLGQQVRGNTPFLDLNHYILVTTVRTGQKAILPAFVHRPDGPSHGTFTGEARFGEPDTGLDDEFDIRVFTTTREGDLVTVPEDAMYSDAVRVTRTQPASGILLAITSPAEGAAVGVDETVLGQTSLPDLNHYIVVTPLRIGTAFVQDERVSVNRSNGTFSARARFGAAQVGMGEQFSVRVLATKATLRAGPLTSEEGTISSNAVTVTRQK